MRRRDWSAFVDAQDDEVGRLGLGARLVLLGERDCIGKRAQSGGEVSGKDDAPEKRRGGAGVGGLAVQW